jgi:hypothetical protein
MPRARRRTVIAATLAVAVVGLFAGGAAAVSSGGYEPSEQDCSKWAESNTGRMEPGCHNFKLNVEDGHGNRYVQFGLAQQAVNENTHKGDFRINTNSDGGGLVIAGAFDTNWEPIPADQCGLFDLAIYPFELLLSLAGQGGGPCTFDPTAWNQPAGPPTVTPIVETGTPDGSIASMAQGAHVYLGADDNLDTGEHDGVDGLNGTRHSANGPSDGGAIVVNWHPTDAALWVAALSGIGTDPGTFLANPLPLIDAGFGSCADNTCFSVQTTQRTVYQGGSKGERNVYDYTGKDWDPEECSSGNPNDETKCDGGKGHPHNMDQYRKAEKKNVVAEPGVQVYGDPDAQASPIGPYPLPAAYVGTCGVAAGGGAAPAPDSPVTNGAGQIMVSTGC